MIFGDPSEFAIEAMTEPELVAPTQPWGRMCIRAGLGEAFKLGVQAGRMAYEAGRIDSKLVATASSPTEGVAAPAGSRS